MQSGPVLIGIDVGGTFTDFVVLEDGVPRFKAPTTPDDQSRAIVDGLMEMGLLGDADADSADAAGLTIVHGTTVATNALLERRGARTALLTTRGFADVLEIGRQNRPHLYRLQQQRPPALIPRPLRFEVDERLDVNGDVLIPLDEAALEETLDALLAEKPESVAIAFLFSYRNPDHEERVAQRLSQRAPDLPISRSSDVLPEYREYERTATTAINAYVLPLVARYVGRLTASLGSAVAGGPDRSPLRIMQSNGGAIGARQAAQQPARLVLSGPAGGVVGAFALAAQALSTDAGQGGGAADGAEAGEDGGPQIMTFDMGGTSTDVALCPGRVPRSAESDLDGLPLRLPVIDIHTVGAGGGSVARVDAGGGLRVGPESAGAVPGPICYGRGGSRPTVTDANLVLGRLHRGEFLGGGGAVQLDAAAAEAALAQLGRELGGLSAQQAALGVIRVANATMERALRRVSVERGHDPRAFTLVPFGGAGPLHACDLARALGVERILLPPAPGVLSALGLLLADVVHESARAVLADAARLAADPTELEGQVRALAAENRRVLAAEGVDQPRIEAALDMRYRGQSYELTVPLVLPGEGDGPAALGPTAIADAVEAFHQRHRARYGYRADDAPVEAVTLRVRGVGPGARPTFRHTPPGDPDPSEARIGTQPIWFGDDGADEATAFARPRLRSGHRFAGPAIVYQFDTTIVVPPGWQAVVDPWDNLLLRDGGRQS